MDNVELSVVIPCLNEEETLEIVINKALKCMHDNDIVGEVVVADNGSTDKSIKIAERCGARVAHIDVKGYGSALIGGIKSAKGKYCIMGDADDSYDFLGLAQFVEKLREGYDFVIGNRYKGGIQEGAMPFLHQYIGTPAITLIGKLLFNIKGVGDFNCGMRGFDREKILDLHLSCPGMEFASEMIVECAKHKYKIAEVPITLSKDGRSGEPHLRTWHDGFRHLKLLVSRRFS